MQNHSVITANNGPSINRQELEFKEYILGNKRHRIIIYVIVTLILIEWVLFKYFYPNAGFIYGDSFNYIQSAHQNLKINTYMIGYAKILRLVSVFSSTDFALVTFQFLFMQAAGLLLLFTAFYFYSPSKAVQLVLSVFFVLNPLFLYMANYVSSDAIFLALSLIWFSCLLWLIHKPTRKLIIAHAIILFITFTVRYNALIYPLIALLAFVISPLTLRKKILGFGLSLLLLGSFVFYTSLQYKKLTGFWQYAPFSGWQLANNAMYAYRYIDSAERKPMPNKFKALDNMIRKYFDSSRDTRIHPVEKMMASTIYMWDRRISPLYIFRDSLFKKDTTASEFKKWASMGPLYKEYGIYVIKQYPQYFLKYFIWVNANKYYAPPLEFLESYNSGKDSTTSIGKTWFNYSSTKLSIRAKDNNVHILDFFPILSGGINALMLFCVLFFISLKGTSSTIVFKKAVFIGGSLWLINGAFTIFASSVALRFQAFPILLTFLFTTLLVDWLIKVAFNKNFALNKQEIMPELKTKIFEGELPKHIV